MIENPLKVGVITAMVVPPGGGLIYVAYDQYSMPKEIKTMYYYERIMGGCEFWLVRSRNTQDGWHKWEALNSELRNSGGKDKLKQFIDQLENGLSDSDNQGIANECSKRRGRLLELHWGNNKWSVAYSWGDKEHRKVDA